MSKPKSTPEKDKTFDLIVKELKDAAGYISDDDSESDKHYRTGF